MVIDSGGNKQAIGRRLARFALMVLAGVLACGLLAVSAQAAKPTIENVSAKSITSKRARLEATINPGGLETTYEFWVEFAVCQNPPLHSGVCEAIAVGTDGKGQLAAGSSAQNVDTTLTHLSPGYLYSYWVVATNSAGEEKSSTQALTALPAPVVDSESTSGVTSSEGTLEAQINPEGQSVYYQFQLVENPSEYATELECQGVEIFCKESAMPPWLLKIGYLSAGSEATDVKLDLAQVGITLKPDKTYHYRVLVAPSVQTEDTVQWDGPPVEGADETFTTLEEPGGPTKKGTGGSGGTGGGSGGGSGGGPGGGSSSGSGSQSDSGPYQPVYGLPRPGHGHKAGRKGHHKGVHAGKHKHHKSKASERKHHKTGTG